MGDRGLYLVIIGGFMMPVLAVKPKCQNIGTKLRIVIEIAMTVAEINGINNILVCRKFVNAIMWFGEVITVEQT